MVKPTSKRSKKGITAQAMVEFALALPILLLIVYGLLETGRLLFIYASVVSAARQAARYGSASGDIGTGTLYYNDCSGIQAAARKLEFIQKFSAVNIAYDAGPGNPISGGCPTATITDNEHRIDVTVSAQWTPIVRLVPFRPFTITSTSNRTIITGVSVAVDQSIATLSAGGTGVLVMQKTSDISTYTSAGQVIHYTYTLLNNGTDPVLGIIVSDSRGIAVTCSSSMPFSLGPNATMVCTASDMTTQANVDGAETITNTGTATGTTPTGQTVTATSTKNVAFLANPALTLTKLGTAPATIAVGNSITYTFTLQNTGNVALSSPFAIQDNTISSWSCSGAGTSIAVGASTTCTGAYVLKNTDLNRGYVDNTAKATATYQGSTVTSNSASAHTLIPDLLLVVSTPTTSVSTPTQVVYTYTLRNNTTSAITGITVSDNHGTTNLSCLSTLASGATSNCTSTNTIAITQADIDASASYVYTATARGTQGAKAITSNQAGVTITIVRTPALTLAKSANPTAPPSGTTFTLPQTITYSYTLQNTGNVTISAPFTITDDKLGTVCSVATGTLAPTASLSPACSKSYTLVPADLDAGAIVNHATATGVFSGSTITSNQATATVVTYTQARMAILKTANVAFFTASGQTIVYTYTLKNTGGQALTLTNYTFLDDKLGTIACATPMNLPLAGSVGCKTTSYQTTAADVTAKKVINNVSPSGGTVTPALTNSPSASLTIPLFICDATTVKGSGVIPNGSTATWTITNNSGLPINIASATVTWSGGGVKLQSFSVNGSVKWSGSANSGIVVPGAPWTLNNGANPIGLTFNGTASSIRVVIGFQELSCNFFLDSNVP